MALIDLFRPRPTIVRHVRVTTASVLGKSVEELYRTQPALRAVVGFLADNVGSLPLKVYDRVGDTDRPRVTDGVAPELLARPNAHTSPQQLWNGVAFDVLLYGSSLVYVAPSADAPCGWEMTRIPWSWVADELTEDGLYPTAYKVRNPDSGRGEVTLAASLCVLFRTYDPLGPNHTSSPVDALRQVLAEQISAWNFRNGVWKNGGRVSQVLTRPLNAEWSPEARKRFAKSWKERFSGEEGTNTGGTPLLEDGMKLESVQFNAREAQWQEATRLTREDVAAVYHVNPALVWHTDGQTYASAKDNARALYADTLAPFLNMVEGVINSFLLPMIGAPSTQYAEFDIEAKLAGSFEERASVLQSSVGGPWITRNEARAKLNMPAVEGGNELIVPLNVTEGGLSSPNDTDPTVARNTIDAIARKVAGFLAAPREPSAGVGLPAPKAAAPPTPGDEGHGRVGDRVQGQAEPVVTLKSRAEAPDASTAAIEECLVRFLERQSRRVLNDLAGKSRRPSGKDGGEGDGEYPFWWDAARWNRELADDLEPIFRTLCDLRGTAAMADIGEPAESWDSSRTANFVRAMAERRADLFNETTYEELAAALMEFDEGDPRRITAAERAFLSNAENRAVRGARTFGTAVAGFATKEAVRQRYPRDTDRIRRTKTWRHHSSKTPRSSHAAMDGETVGLDDVFSNGADYPGDLALSAKDAVNCHCTMEVGVVKRPIEVGGGSGGGRLVETRVLNPESEFMRDMTPDELDEMVRERFGCRTSPGFSRLPMEMRQPLMADLEAAFDDFPIAMRGLRAIGVSGDLEPDEAARCDPVDPYGGWNLVLNRDFFADVESVAARYGVSLANGNMVAGSSWPSLAYHEAVHGAELALCAGRHRDLADFWSAWSIGEVAGEVVGEAYDSVGGRSTGFSCDELVRRISGYAGKNDSEALCEACRDARVNGPDAQPISLAIVELLRSRL